MALGENVFILTSTGTAQALSSTTTDYFQVTVQAFSSNGSNAFLKFNQAGTAGTVDISTANYELPALASVQIDQNSNESVNGQGVDLSKWFFNGSSGIKIRVSAQYRYET